LTKLKSDIFEIAVTSTYSLLQLPEDSIAPFLEKNLKRVKVKASFEGNELHFHGAIQKRNGAHFMMFGKRYQKAIGVFPNDYFQLQLFEDDSKYGVEMPEELDAVLQSDTEALALFESFTAGKKRGIIYMIARYKNAQTKIDKSLLVCQNLKRGIRHNPDLIKSF